jgi:hypothetical protein
VASAVGLALAETGADADQGDWTARRRRQPRWTALAAPFGARARPPARTLTGGRHGALRRACSGFRFGQRRDDVWHHEEATCKGKARVKLKARFAESGSPVLPGSPHRLRRVYRRRYRKDGLGGQVRRHQGGLIRPDAPDPVPQHPVLPTFLLTDTVPNLCQMQPTPR